MNEMDNHDHVLDNVKRQYGILLLCSQSSINISHSQLPFQDSCIGRSRRSKLNHLINERNEEVLVHCIFFCFLIANFSNCELIRCDALKHCAVIAIAVFAGDNKARNDGVVGCGWTII